MVKKWDYFGLKWNCNIYMYLIPCCSSSLCFRSRRETWRSWSLPSLVVWGSSWPRRRSARRRNFRSRKRRSSISWRRPSHTPRSRSANWKVWLTSFASSWGKKRIQSNSRWEKREDRCCSWGFHGTVVFSNHRLVSLVLHFRESKISLEGENLLDRIKIIQLQLFCIKLYLPFHL